MSKLFSKIAAVLIVLALLGVAGFMWFLRGEKDYTMRVAPAVETEMLAAHKAIYIVSLHSTKNTSQISNIGGQMFYAIRKSCEGWITQNRFNLVYEYPDSPAMRLLSDFSNVESGDGETLQFITRRKRDGDLFEEFRGTATEKDHKVLFASPEVTEMALPSGTLFPITHTAAVIKAIHEGRKIFSATVFDGSDAEGAVEINTVSGGAITEEKKAGYLDEKMRANPLLQAPAWKLRMAFFPLADDSDQSDYEMTGILHENGVISHMIIDYDDFSIEQKLVALEPLEAESCDGMATKVNKTKSLEQ